MFTDINERYCRSSAILNKQEGAYAMRARVIFLGCLMLAAAISAVANAEELRHEWSFDGIHSIAVNTITGSVTIRTAKQKTLTVAFESDPKRPKTITPSVDSVKGVLTIRETTSEKHAQAKTHWLISVPESSLLKAIGCHSAQGDIRFDSIVCGRIVSHSATGRLSAADVKSRSVRLTTTSMPLRVTGGEISHDIRCVSASGEVYLSLSKLPDSALDAASTSNAVTLDIPSFGENFTLTIDRNEGAGQVESPFSCTETSTSLLHPQDTYKTTRCVVKRGEGGSAVRLLTGTGTIKIITGQ